MKVSPSSNQDHNEAPASGLRVRVFRLILILAVVGVLTLAWASLSRSHETAPSHANATLVALATDIGRTPSAAASVTASAVPATPRPVSTRQGALGTIVFSARHGAHDHLWAVSPGEGSPILLTDGAFDDRDPAISPDGSQVAFASNRGGPWDLYLLSLSTGDVRQLTETSGTDGHPTWSPDGRWIAYEAYSQTDYDIWILSVDGSQGPIQLTNAPGLDISPTWDPSTGRRIAFVSDRSGSDDIFIANLDRPQDRFENVTHSASLNEADPVFSPDGSKLAYDVNVDGIRLIRILDAEHPDRPATVLAQGRLPRWSPDGTMMLAVLDSPLESRFVGYGLDGSTLAPLTVSQVGGQLSLDWTSAGFNPAVGQAGLSAGAPRAQLGATPVGIAPDQGTLIDLHGVNAPNPTLIGAANEAFQALRQAAAQEAGWDFLAKLGDAFVGLNDPLPPGFAYNDWLYTGRAFAFDQAAYQSGDVYLVREDFGAQTFWRVFLRAGKQDGTEGRPLRVHPWDLNARFSGNPDAYDQGGQRMSAVPQGYFVDFTALAAAFGFERQPALPNWRTFYPGARFDEFAFTQGLDWLAAMLELYPPSAIATPTVYHTPTPTPTNTPRPTPTPWWWRWRTPTPSPAAGLPTQPQTP